MKIKSIGKRGKRSVRKCLYCGEEFSELNIKLRSGKGKFCSNECYIKYRKEHSLDYYLTPSCMIEKYFVKNPVIFNLKEYVGRF